ncbi:FAD/NAD(P)-binding oxidoreductase [Deltaproteobacteria bacterium TL4]
MSKIGNPKSIIIGEGIVSCATIAAQCGHDVTVFETSSEIGGQFNVAKKVPGKEEFFETLRYFDKQLKLKGVKVELNKKVTASELIAGQYDEVVLATGVVPRVLPIPGIEHAKVLSYLEVLLEGKPVGKSVAIIGAGGIGINVAEFLTHEGTSSSVEIDLFLKEWGIDKTLNAPGGIGGVSAEIHPSPRKIYLLDQRPGKIGPNLGKTTAWIHRQSLKNKKVEMLLGVMIDSIDDQGIHLTLNGKSQVLEVDHVVVCAGQLSLCDLKPELEEAGVSVHTIGGAKMAADLDAKRAIKDGHELALSF